MGKLGVYSYPDIRFGDAVQIAGRILTKFKGAVGVKGLAWELGMAENSGTLFAKVAALRDFGLVDGRGELRVTSLAQRILHPTTEEEGKQARVEAFMRVELLRQLYQRFNGDIPDDTSFFIVLEETCQAPRMEIVKRAGILQKHLTDLVRSMNREKKPATAPEHSAEQQQIFSQPLAPVLMTSSFSDEASGLYLVASQTRFMAPLTRQNIDTAIGILNGLKEEMVMAQVASASGEKAED